MNRQKGFSEDDLAAVSDNSEWTAEDFANAKPFRVMFPHLTAGLRDKGATVQTDDTATEPVAIDRDLVELFKANGPGWEAR